MVVTEPSQPTEGLHRGRVLYIIEAKLVLVSSRLLQVSDVNHNPRE